MYRMALHTHPPSSRWAIVAGDMLQRVVTLRFDSHNDDHGNLLLQYRLEVHSLGGIRENARLFAI